MCKCSQENNCSCTKRNVWDKWRLICGIANHSARARARQKDRIQRGKEAQASLGQEGNALYGIFKTPTSLSASLAASTVPWALTNQQMPSAGCRGDRRPLRDGFTNVLSAVSGSSQLPLISQVDGQRVTSSSASIINVEKSRTGNVSYPHRVYTVPGTPVNPTSGSAIPEHGVPGLRNASPSNLFPGESRTIDTGVGKLRKELLTEKSSKVDVRREDTIPSSVTAALQSSSMTSQALRQLLPPLAPGSSFQFGSSGLPNLRAPPLLFEGTRRLFNHSGSATQTQPMNSEPTTQILPQDGGDKGSRALRRGSEEHTNETTGKATRRDPDLQGSLSQLDHAPLCYGRDTYSSGVSVWLSSTQEILKVVYMLFSCFFQVVTRG